MQKGGPGESASALLSFATISPARASVEVEMDEHEPGLHALLLTGDCGALLP
jgi:hypothetical protein